jgi:hypothetical protein
MKLVMVMEQVSDGSVEVEALTPFFVTIAIAEVDMPKSHRLGSFNA